LRCKPDAADLIAVVLAHRVQAERYELHRVAVIYTVLATIDQPMSTFAKIACPVQADHCQLADAVE